MRHDVSGELKEQTTPLTQFSKQDEVRDQLNAVHEGRQMKFYMELRENAEKERKLHSGVRTRLISIYNKAVATLREKIPPSLLVPKIQSIAKLKLEFLLNARFSAARYDNISNVIGNFRDIPKWAEGKQALPMEMPESWLKKVPLAGFPPHECAFHLVELAYSETRWETANYNSLIFFDGRAYNTIGWGHLKNTSSYPVLGIMVFDPNPEKLLQVAKAMALKRPGDPIPIIDIYGRPFYP